MDCCKKLIDTLPDLVNEENDPEKVADGAIDHWYDAAGYGLIAWHVNQSKPPKAPTPPIRAHKDKLAKRSKQNRRLV